MKKTENTSSNKLLTLLSATIVATSSIYAVKLFTSTINTRTRREMISNSFKIIEDLDDARLVFARTKLERDIKLDKKTDAAFYESIIQDLDMHTAVKSLLTMFTNVSIAIKQSHADEKTLYMALDTFLPSTFEMFLPYIREVRKRRNNNKIYFNANELAETWKSGRFLSTGEDAKNSY